VIADAPNAGSRGRDAAHAAVLATEYAARAMAGSKIGPVTLVSPCVALFAAGGQKTHNTKAESS